MGMMSEALTGEEPRAGSQAGCRFCKLGKRCVQALQSSPCGGHLGRVHGPALPGRPGLSSPRRLAALAPSSCLSAAARQNPEISWDDDFSRSPIRRDRADGH